MKLSLLALLYTSGYSFFATTLSGLLLIQLLTLVLYAQIRSNHSLKMLMPII